MKSNKDILDKLNIKENSKFHNWDYIYKCFFKAMDESSKQAFMHARTFNKTFDEYNKEVGND